jgi:hypothetical protein
LKINTAMAGWKRSPAPLSIPSATSTALNYDRLSTAKQENSSDGQVTLTTYA